MFPVTRSILRLPRCLSRKLPPSAAQASGLRLGGAARPYSEKRRSYWQAVRRWVRGPAAPPFPRPCLVGAPVLRSEAAAVPPAQVGSPEVQRLVAALVRAMRRAGAVGLSAPQLGVPLRVLVVEVTERVLEAEAPPARRAREMVAVPLRVFINPRLRVLDSRTVLWPEACQSLPGFAACVARHRTVEITGLNELGETVTWEATGWAARIIQHEMDHLNGQLYIDKMDSKTFVNINWMEENE